MAGTEKNCLLIVDDVEMNRAILSSIFEDEYKIIEAENGQEALKRLEQNDGQIAAVLLDVVMPVINGFEMLQPRSQGYYRKAFHPLFPEAEDPERGRSVLYQGAAERNCGASGGDHRGKSERSQCPQPECD